MRKLRKKTAALLKDRKGNMMPLVVAVTICMLIIILGVAEYMRLVITAAGIKDAMPQAMSRMGNRFLPRWIMGIFTAECVFYSDWKRTGRDMFESITEERWSTV